MDGPFSAVPMESLVVSVLLLLLMITLPTVWSCLVLVLARIVIVVLCVLVVSYGMVVWQLVREIVSVREFVVMTVPRVLVHQPKYRLLLPLALQCFVCQDGRH